jgi:hypothetical protein
VKRPFWIHLAVTAFYALAAILVTWPLLSQMGERIVGHPFGDAYEYTHHIWWMHEALRSGQSPFFQPLLLYPNGLQAAWLWGAPLQSFPAWLFMFIMPLPAAFNLQALLTLTLNGWAMWLFSHKLLAISNQPKTENIREFEPPRREGRQEEEARTSALSTQHSALNTPPSSLSSPHHFFPALLAGLVFMLYPAFQGQLAAGHTGLLVLWPVPLLALVLLRLVNLTPHPPLHNMERGRTLRIGLSKRDLRLIFAAAVCFMMSLWGSVLLLIYVLTPLLGVYAAYLLWRREWMALLRLIAALGLGALLSAPFLLPILREQIGQPMVLQEDGSVRYSASLLGIVSPSFYHPLFSGLEYPRRVLGIDPFEGASYAGIVAAALALIAIWKVRRARGWLAAAALAWVFSLGPLLKLFDSPLALRVDGYATHISLPWALFQNLPVLSIARTPGRFNFAVGFAVAVLAGYGAAYLWARLKASVRPFVLLALMALIAFEYQFFWELPTVPATIPDAIAALGARDDVRAVFDIPWEHRLTDKDAMYLQTGHGLPMIAGHITRTTPLNPAVGYLLQRTLDPALLERAGADIIILHKQWDDEAGLTDAFLRVRLGAPIFEDERFAVFDVPPYTGDAPGFIASVELPEAIADQGSIYFYAPQPGTVTLRGQVAADGARRARLALDSEIILEWTVQGQIGLDVPVELDSAGYHTLTIAADPPCPVDSDPTLRCNALRVSDVELENYTPHPTS